MKRRMVGILLFPECEPLDFAGPFEVFGGTRPAPASLERFMTVATIAETSGPVTCRYGLKVIPDHTLESSPPFDVLIVPGGPGTAAAARRAQVVDWIRRTSRTAELVASVCTGSFLLAQAGLLDGLEATTHWASIDRFQKEFPSVKVREAIRWIDAGRILTSAGVSAGIDLALHMVSRLYGPEAAQATAKGLEYDYWPPALGS